MPIATFSEELLIFLLCYIKAQISMSQLLHFLTRLIGTMHFRYERIWGNLTVFLPWIYVLLKITATHQHKKKKCIEPDESLVWSSMLDFRKAFHSFNLHPKAGSKESQDITAYSHNTWQKPLCSMIFLSRHSERQTGSSQSFQAAFLIDWLF